MKNIKLIALLICTIAINSCSELLDDSVTDFGRGPIVLEFSGQSTTLNLVQSDTDEGVPYTATIQTFGGDGLAVDRPIDFTVAVNSASTAVEGTDFTIASKTITIPAGSKSADVSVTIFPNSLTPFVTKDIVLELVSSSETISDVSTTTITLKAVGADNLAGRYEVVESSYFRLGVPGASPAPGTIRVIETINPTTYVHPFFGNFDGKFYFTVDGNDITVLKTNPETNNSPIFQGTAPIINCDENPNDLTHVPCGANSNIVERSATRNDVIRITYGYFTPGSGAREFYEVLRRIE